MNEEEKKAIEWFKEDLTKEKEEMEYYNEYKKQIIKRNEKLLNIIEKQQKEIEVLEIIHTTYKEMIEENNYISKDKIREKIEHYNNELEHIKNGEEFENEKPMYYWGKVALENLLEEN